MLEGGRGGRHAGILEGSHGISGGKWVRVGSTRGLPHQTQQEPLLCSRGVVTGAQGRGRNFSKGHRRQAGRRGSGDYILDL